MIVTQRDVELDRTDQPTTAADRHECEFCGQPVAESELVTVSLEDESTQSMCVFCASSMFEDVDAEALTRSDSTAEAASTDAIAPPEEKASTRASAVSWSPPAVESASGVTGTLLRAHYLSLSLFWAVHRTNVRIVERILDEIDVQLITVLVVVLSAMIALVAGLSV